MQEIKTDTIKNKIYALIGNLYYMEFPIIETMRRLELQPQINANDITGIEVKFTLENGNQQIIYFNELEIHDIKTATNLKKRITELELAKRNIFRMIRDMHDEIVLLENTE